ncbi:methyltransferase domain-containing protein [Bacillus mangrovi]|uniref:Methyltransferase domain-containing protein n=2 Tax=Metabacillus mangrovi TaxID=1491830 RepID=A0A7X2V699_9BACI|nr:O-methyltransferase [Metabacillus mangrovi]MTH55021.1 methyltransferase domain-containing protein [Metabacillus mangrovi]
MNEIWSQVDHYFTSKLHPEDPVMDAVLQANTDAGLPAIDVSPTQGKLLYLLAKMKGAKNILEIGTLGGYSSIWLARALPEDGRLTTLEYSPKHAETARKNIEHAGLSDKIEIVVGAALDTLPTLSKGFDFIFIDADKPNNPGYLEWALKLAQPGAVVIGDNVVRDGRIVDEGQDDSVEGTKKFFDLLSASSEIDSTAIQTVGSKGYDGFSLGIVK